MEKEEIENLEGLGLYGIKEAYSKDIKSSNTIFYKGSLRSGNKLENEGSIVIIGDLKAGAEAVAGENIVVLGQINGLAHAGAKGNRKAIISANKIDCPQIRIADKIKEFEKTELTNTLYTYTYINEKKEICIE